MTRLTETKAGPAKGGHRIPHPADVCVLRDSIVLPGAEDFHMGKLITRGGIASFEPEVFAVLCAYLETQADPLRFLDIGANIGIFSLVVKAIFGSKVQVTAFEPLPRLNSFLRAAARENGLQIDVISAALSNREGRSEFYVSSQSDTSNSLNPRFRPHKDVIEVDVRTLDSLYPEPAKGTWIVKIDTESTEPDVLAGAASFIARARPVIICEVLAGRTENQLGLFFAEAGYTPIHITAAPSWETAQEVAGDRTYAFRDWLFVPQPPARITRERFAAWHSAFRSAVESPPASAK